MSGYHPGNKVRGTCTKIYFVNGEGVVPSPEPDLSLCLGVFQEKMQMNLWNLQTTFFVLEKGTDLCLLCLGVIQKTKHLPAQEAFRSGERVHPPLTWI